MVTVLVSAIVRIWGGVSRVVKSSVVALVFGETYHPGRKEEALQTD